MAAAITKIIVALCIGLIPMIGAANPDGTNNYLDVEAPSFFNYRSPLQQPDSLRSRPYFDFLSTLYRRDATKSNLFRQYTRTRREAPLVAEAQVGAVPPAPVPAQAHVEDALRPKRAIVFRPLFVYKQQEIRKEEIQAKRRRRI